MVVMVVVVVVVRRGDRLWLLRWRSWRLWRLHSEVFWKGMTSCWSRVLLVLFSDALFHVCLFLSLREDAVHHVSFGFIHFRRSSTNTASFASLHSRNAKVLSSIFSPHTSLLLFQGTSRTPGFGF